MKLVGVALLLGVAFAIETALPPPRDVVAYVNTLKVPVASDLSEQGARKYLKELDVQKGKANNAAALAEWAYTSNITKANLDQKVSTIFRSPLQGRFETILRPIR